MPEIDTRTKSLTYLRVFQGLTREQREEAIGIFTVKVKDKDNPDAKPRKRKEFRPDEVEVQFRGENAYLNAVLFQMFGAIYRNVMRHKQHEDAFHDLLVKLLVRPDYKLPEYGQSVMPWAMKVIRNAETDEYRQQSNRRRILLSNAVGWNRRILGPEEACLVKEQQREIMAWLKGLPRKDAAAVAIRLEGYEMKEIAEIMTGNGMTITANAVRQRLKRIRAEKKSVLRRLGVQV